MTEPRKTAPKPWPLWTIALAIAIYLLLQVAWIVFNDEEPSAEPTVEDVAD